MIKGSARGNQVPGQEALSVKQLSGEYPRIKKVLKELGVPVQNESRASLGFLCEEAGVDPADVFARLQGRSDNRIPDMPDIRTLTVLPGRDKSGRKETSEPLTFHRGDIIAVVGPTGSGKSRFLSDIEGLVQGDSPSGRYIHLDGKPADDNLRIFQTNKPIAQISQSMNYLLDLTVGEFIDIRRESRGEKRSGTLKKKIIGSACSLCGEPFSEKTPMTGLSGGQARALMIADAVFVSSVPVLLVDEIENAGIDREKAVNLLLKENGITIIATHDPLIALLARKRIILENGGIRKVIEQTDEENRVLEFLKKNEERMKDLKDRLRAGEILSDH